MSLWNPRTWFKNSKCVDSNSSDNYNVDNHSNNHLKPSNSSEGQTLSDIIRGIAHAASAANEIQDQQFIKQIGHYFHREEDGTLVPKIVRAKVDDNTFIEVPLLSMIDPSTLGLEEMEVRMGVRLSRTDIKKRIHDADENVEVSRSSFSVSLTSAQPGKRQDVIDVTMKFKKIDPAEGSSRLVEEMNGTIQPKSSGNIDKNDLKTNIFHKTDSYDDLDFEPQDIQSDESDESNETELDNDKI